MKVNVRAAKQNNIITIPLIITYLTYAYEKGKSKIARCARLL